MKRSLKQRKTLPMSCRQKLSQVKQNQIRPLKLLLPIVDLDKVALEVQVVLVVKVAQAALEVLAAVLVVKVEALEVVVLPAVLQVEAVAVVLQPAVAVTAAKANFVIESFNHKQLPLKNNGHVLPMSPEN